MVLEQEPDPAVGVVDPPLLFQNTGHPGQGPEIGVVSEAQSSPGKNLTQIVQAFRRDERVPSPPRLGPEGLGTSLFHRPSPPMGGLRSHSKAASHLRGRHPLAEESPSLQATFFQGQGITMLLSSTPHDPRGRRATILR